MNVKISCLLLVFSTTTWAQNQQSVSDSSKVLEEVTIVESKSKMLFGSGEYINNQRLSNLNQPDVNKVLRVVPGVNIRDEEGFGLRPNIGLRGTPVNRSAKITLMEDGILIAPAPYADPSAYYFPTFARMAGVEVLKGSSQIKYGPYTIGGAVNLLSTPIPNSFQGLGQVSYGSFGTNQQRFWVGDSQSRFDYLFEVNRLASNGFKELDNGGNTGFDRRDFMAKLRWHTAMDAKIKQSLTLKVVNTTEDGNESYLGLTYQDFLKNPNRRYAATQKDLLTMQHQDISLSHTITLSPKISFNTTAYYSYTFRDWGRVNSIGDQSINNILSNPAAYSTAYSIMTGESDGKVVFQGAARKYYSKGIQTNLQYQFSSGAVSHKIQLGLRIHDDRADRLATQSTYNMIQKVMVLTNSGVNGNSENQIRYASSTATYLSYILHFKNLTINPGVRYEDISLKIENFGTADNGRLGTNLRRGENHINVFLPSIGINYEFNNYSSLFAGIYKGFSPPGTPMTNTSNLQAKPESALNYEVGYRLEKSGIKSQLTLFHNNYSNILGSDNMSGGGLGTGDTYNAGDANTDGVEFSLGYDLLQLKKYSNTKLPLNLAYTYTNARFDDTFINAGGDWGNSTINSGDVIPFITPHQLNVSLGIEKEKLSIYLTGRYTGATRIKPSQGISILPGNTVTYNDINTLPAYWIYDISGNYKWSKLLTSFILINNLTNNQPIVANLPQGYRSNIPISLTIGLKVTL
ncbi:TonB-dependent receptor [Flectobacillus sp. DC10W]|uniref:TonB-dependent receptor n=1 Tax=Flectobacillus longus TaxID=2984207 RepID=A0ABT6YTM1_9BACT|nr:TonB-dependent receptor [Flectobacillus longus]MDI9866947.1 TonB-dependent receptor [Flectobacillus longus]